MAPDEPELSFLQLPLPRTFALRLLTIPGGCHLAYDAGAWDDALVVVEQGELELECLAGGSRAFACGAVLSLAGLPLRSLRNAGSEPVLLAAVTRTDPPGSEERTT